MTVATNDMHIYVHYIDWWISKRSKHWTGICKNFLCETCVLRSDIGNQTDLTQCEIDQNIEWTILLLVGSVTKHNYCIWKLDIPSLHLFWRVSFTESSMASNGKLYGTQHSMTLCCQGFTARRNSKRNSFLYVADEALYSLWWKCHTQQ